jgi:hypothetical protein
MVSERVQPEHVVYECANAEVIMAFYDFQILRKAVFTRR